MSNPNSTNGGDAVHLALARATHAGLKLSRAIRDYRARRALGTCDHVGEGAELFGIPSIRNHGRLEIGARVRLVSEPVVSHLVVEHGAMLRLGDGVRVAHGCGVAASTSIEIGNDVRIGAFTLILDSDYHVPGDPSAPPPCTPIRIRNGVRIGQRVVVLRGSEIGEGAIIGDGSVVSGMIPAGASVAGVPAREIAPETSLQAGHGSVLERVASIVARTFRLPQLPKPEQGPNEIAAWDSLGALSLLFALEGEFGVVLDESAFARVSTIQKAADAVERTLALRTPVRPVRNS